MTGPGPGRRGPDPLAGRLSRAAFKGEAQRGLSLTFVPATISYAFLGTAAIARISILEHNFLPWQVAPFS